MCIICRLSDPGGGIDDAFTFLEHYKDAQRSMKLAEAALLLATRSMNDNDARRYRRVQKQMARIRRAWNCVEHEREVEHEAAGTPWRKRLEALRGVVAQSNASDYRIARVHRTEGDFWD